MCVCWSLLYSQSLPDHRNTVQNSYYLRSWAKLRDPGQTVVDVTRPGSHIRNLEAMNMRYDGVILCTLVTVGLKPTLLCYQDLVLDSDKQELMWKSVTRSHHDRQRADINDVSHESEYLHENAGRCSDACRSWIREHWDRVTGSGYGHREMKSCR